MESSGVGDREERGQASDRVCLGGIAVCGAFMSRKE